MEARTVTVSEKGQIAIPIEMRKQVGISEGDTLFLVREGKRILIEKAEVVAEKLSADFKKLKSEFSQWDKLSDEAWAKFEEFYLKWKSSQKS